MSYALAVYVYPLREAFFVYDAPCGLDYVYFS